jgi:hypothetical protein
MRCTLIVEPIRMLKTRDAVAEMADLMGMSLRANQYLTRLLREDGSDLWPAIGTGRRGGVVVEHLVNNLIANYCAPGQPSDGPKVAREFHLLRSGTYRNWERILPPNLLMSPDSTWSGGWEKTFEDQPLFRFLCTYVRKAVYESSGKPIGDTDIPTFLIRLRSQGQPMEAIVHLYFPETKTGISYNYSITAPQLDLDIEANIRPRPAELQVIIGRAELAAIANVAQKVAEFDALKISPQPPGRGVAGDAIPETKKAAGPGSHDSLQSDQSVIVSSSGSRRAQTRPLDKDESNAQQGRKQSAARGGRLRMQAGYQPPTARSRRHGTSRSDATSPQAG